MQERPTPRDGEFADAAVRMERRLGKIENLAAQNQVDVQSGFASVNRRLDLINGSIRDHERRLNEVDVIHAREDGAASERMRLNWRDRLLLLAAPTGIIVAAIITRLSE